MTTSAAGLQFLQQLQRFSSEVCAGSKTHQITIKEPRF
jgi:hypothetical protein